MLIRFAVTNFLSFCERTEFNMLTGNVRKKPEHVYQHGAIEVVRAAALYGANGAGKSNLIKAVDFLKKLVLAKELNPQPFKLKKACLEQPSVFEIEFVKEGRTYYYEVAVLGNTILREELYAVQEGKDDQLLFERQTQDNKTSLVVAEQYQQNTEDKVLVELYAKKLLKPTELFLTRVQEDDIEFEELKQVWEWFFDNLFLIYPHTAGNLGALLTGVMGSNITDTIKESISKLDTGIKAIQFRTYPLEEYYGEDDKPTIEWIRKNLSRDNQEKNTIFSVDERDIIYHKKGDEFFVIKLVLEHQTQEEDQSYFDLEEESDGTKRILDILIHVNTAKFFDRTILIDEIDRSIHPSLTKAVVKSFMDTPVTKGQLIFTTHEANLLDLNIFRQDEIWFAEKNKEGATTLYPMSDFKVRSDLSIKKGYLNGRFGAIPFLGDFEALNWQEPDRTPEDKKEGERG